MSDEKKVIRWKTKKPDGTPSKYDSRIARQPLPEDPFELFRALKENHVGEVEAKMEWVRETANSVFKEAGLPSGLHPLDYLGLIDRDEPTPMAAMADAYAATFFLEKALKEGNAYESARQSMRMEGHVSKWILLRIEYSTAVGEKQLQAPLETVYTDSDKAKWESEAKKLFDTNPEYRKPRKQRAIAEKVAEITLSKFETVRAHFKKKNIPGVWVEG